jgi:hypothetical protein
MNIKKSPLRRFFRFKNHTNVIEYKVPIDGFLCDEDSMKQLKIWLTEHQITTELTFN